MPFTRHQSRLASAGTPAPTSPAERRTTAMGTPAMTPKAKSALSLLTSITHRQPKTPKDKSPIRPEEPEMHPQKDHRTSATPYDEARWLGFFHMGAQTAPAAKTASFTAAQMSPTPTKIMTRDAPTDPSMADGVSSPEFKFTFRRAPSVELSEDAQKIMAESRVEAARIRAQLSALPTVPDTELEEPSSTATGRKIAKLKSKSGRFSDVHMAGFEKMDSIANHASAWRVDPNRNKSATPTLTRSPSKAELDKPTVPKNLKRSPSKAELDAPAARTLQRSSSKPALKKIESNPFLTKSPSKLGLNVRATALEERPVPSAKRVKHVKGDDAGTTRPQHVESPLATPQHQTQSLSRQKSGLLRPGFSSATSPTKSSMARVQSVHDLKTTARTPTLTRSNTSNDLRQVIQVHTSTLPRSKSMKNLNVVSTPRAVATTIKNAATTPTPIKIGVLSHDSPVKAPELATSSPISAITPKRIKSILRTPNRRYTRDPVKIAAGTHLATPPQPGELYPNLPATEPVTKRVNFTNSTKQEAERNPIKKAVSAEPESVAYPDLIAQDINRRTTMSAMPNMPGAFTFRSNREIAFPSPKTSTIRQVRTSNAGLPSAFQFTGIYDSSSPSKRKLDTLDEAGEMSEKENRDEDDEHRPAKKARIFSLTKSAPATPVAKKEPSKSKLPRFGGIGGKRTSGLTAARLSMLAKPKRRV